MMLAKKGGVMAFLLLEDLLSDDGSYFPDQLGKHSLKLCTSPFFSRSVVTRSPDRRIIMSSGEHYTVLSLFASEKSGR